MSAIVNIDSIPLEKRKKMITDLSVKSIPKKEKAKYAKQATFNVYEIIDENFVTVPFSYYYHFIGGFPNANIKFESLTAKFNMKLFDRQINIREEALSMLNNERCIILSLATGFGKSYFALYLACKIGLKTIIFSHRTVIMDQWIKSIKNACGADTIVQTITAKNKINYDAQFYVINVTTVPKRDRLDYEHIGNIIIDEAHTICTEKFSKSLTYITPKYLIGCTATPVRNDGQDRVIELFAGVNVIYRPLNALFNVYTYNTNFKPTIKKTDEGTMIWGSVIESQAEDVNRNILIIDIIRYFSTRNIIVLCKLKKHATLLAEALQQYNIDADTYMGSQKVLNFDCRVLVATYSKSGVGMDHPKLDMLLLAGDCEDNWVQYLGRVFRREHHIPIIVDLIDSKFRPLKNHSDTRINICRESGGEIKKLNSCFPLFEYWRSTFNTIL